MSQGGVGPAGANLHPACQDVNDGPLASGDTAMNTLDYPRPAPSLDEPHLIAEVVRIEVRLVVDNENFAIGWAIFQHGQQGVVQLQRIAQNRNDDRQPMHV